MGEARRGRVSALSARDEFEIWQNREAGVSVKDCAALAGVSEATVLRVMAKLRLKLGRMEKLPNGRRARSHLRGRTDLAVA